MPVICQGSSPSAPFHGFKKSSKVHLTRKGRMAGHGFRSIALNEQGYRHDFIEQQLVHAERNEARAACDRAECLPERKKMMQEWATAYLGKLKAGAEDGASK